MKEADRTPSPNRSCRKFGMRNAALNASALSLNPRERARKCCRTSPARRLMRMPVATSVAARPDRSRGAGAPALAELGCSLIRCVAHLPGENRGRVLARARLHLREQRRAVAREHWDEVEHALLRLAERKERGAR